MTYKFTVEEIADVPTLIIHLDGELDHHSAKPLREEIDKQLKNYSVKNCIIDMKCVSFMDSSGLGVILGRYRLLKNAGCTLSIRNPNKTIDRLLKLSGIYSIVNVAKNI